MAGDRAELYHGLSVMLAAGVPTLKSLQLTAKGRRTRLARAFRDVAEAVSRGDGLAETMAKHPKVFPSLDLLVVGVAEESGALPESMELLSGWYAFRDRLRRLMVSGMVLPAVLLHLAAFISPLAPLVLSRISLGQYLVEAVTTLLVFYVPTAVIFAVVRFTPKTGPVRVLLDRVTLSIPLLGRAVRHLALSRYSRAFHMLYKCGDVPIAECTRQAADVTGNAVIRRQLAGGVESARAGSPVSEGFSGELPADFLQSWQVAEEAGSLEDTTSRLARTTAENAENLFAQLAAWLPRLVYFLVCVLIIIQIFKGLAVISQGYRDALSGVE